MSKTRQERRERRREIATIVSIAVLLGLVFILGAATARALGMAMW